MATAENSLPTLVVPSSPPSTQLSQHSLAAYYLGNLGLSDFFVSADRKPSIPFDEFAQQHELPVIDFSAFWSESEADRKLAMRTLCKAAEEWGFFRLVNHIIPSDLLRSIETHALQFFSLPLEQKLEGSRDFQPPYGYVPGSNPSQKHRMWIEALHFHAHADASKVKEILEKICPDEEIYRDFCVDVANYTELAVKLSHQLRELLTEGLGVIPSYFEELYEGENSSVLRFNYYPPCPAPDSVMGLNTHTDPGSLTLLHQNTVGGLQVWKDGNWVGVQPQFGSLIVNLGDCFQVLSNGRFKSGVHRAVLNRDEARLSVVFFYNSKEDAVIQPAAGVVGEDGSHARFRGRSWKEYRAHFFKVELGLDAIKYFELQSDSVQNETRMTTTTTTTTTPE